MLALAVVLGLRSDALAPDSTDSTERLSVLDLASGPVWINDERHRNAAVAVLDQDDLRAIIAVKHGGVVLVGEAKRYRVCRRGRMVNSVRRTIQDRLSGSTRRKTRDKRDRKYLLQFIPPLGSAPGTRRREEVVADDEYYVNAMRNYLLSGRREGSQALSFPCKKASRYSSSGRHTRSCSAVRARCRSCKPLWDASRSASSPSR